jgi:hypothetical protein
MPSLRYVHPTLIVSDSVAIVGSAGKLKNTEHGALIDSFEDVVRFNRAPTEGYEELVGCRETLRVTNNHVFNNNQEDPDIWTHQPRYFVKNLRDTRVLYFASDWAPWYNRGENIHESVDAFLFDYEKVGEIKKLLSLSNQVTVGIGFVGLCISVGIVPHLFGFSTSPDDPRDHYWEDRPPAGPCHDIPGESRTLLRLAKEGKVVLY